MNVKEIVKNWLTENGFDGLQHGGDCGCCIEDLMECGADIYCCTPGYYRNGEEGEPYDYYIVPDKPGFGCPAGLYGDLSEFHKEAQKEALRCCACGGKDLSCDKPLEIQSVTVVNARCRGCNTEMQVYLRVDGKEVVE
jgi:hypothetical protein